MAAVDNPALCETDPRIAASNAKTRILYSNLRSKSNFEVPPLGIIGSYPGTLRSRYEYRNETFSKSKWFKIKLIRNRLHQSGECSNFTFCSRKVHCIFANKQLTVLQVIIHLQYCLILFLIEKLLRNDSFSQGFSVLHVSTRQFYPGDL